MSKLSILFTSLYTKQLLCLKVPAMQSWSTKNRQNQLWQWLMYKNYCCTPSYWPNMNELMYQIKVDYVIMHWNSFVISLFFNEKCWVKPGFPFTQLIELILKTWRKKNNFSPMLYKNYCWAVICHPIWVNNVSYEQKTNWTIIPCY